VERKEAAVKVGERKAVRSRGLGKGRGVSVSASEAESELYRSRVAEGEREGSLDCSGAGGLVEAVRAW